MPLIIKKQKTLIHNMKNTTITIWVHPNDEINFFQYLKIIDDLPIENTYIKFIHSWKFNGGTFS